MTPRRAQLISAVGVGIMRTLIATLRVRVHDQAGVLKGPKTPRLIWAFWHNRMLIIPHLCERYLQHRPGGALTSASRDGEILAAFLRRYHILPIRGSSSRLGTAAVLEMKRFIDDGFDVGITPDGPRGPRYHLNAGIITLAQLTGALVLPIRVRYSKYWQLKSWDGFQIPRPFANVDVTLLPYHRVAATQTEEEFETERARLQTVMVLAEE